MHIEICLEKFEYTYSTIYRPDMRYSALINQRKIFLWVIYKRVATLIGRCLSTTVVIKSLRGNTE